MDRMTDGSSNGTMTDNAMILKKLSEILRRYVEPDPETGDPIVITEETDIFEDLGADSLMVMQIIADVEECFGITFDDVDLLSENFSNTGSYSACHDRSEKRRTGIFRICKKIWAGLSDVSERSLKRSAGNLQRFGICVTDSRRGQCV